MNGFANMVKIQNPEKEYPSEMGQKWTDKEEASLLEELISIDIETIATLHNRTIGGINARRREIAYKMYLKNIPMEKIIYQTKLDDECIRRAIERKTKSKSSKLTPTETLREPFETKLNLESEIVEMKNEIKELKNTIKELVDMMKTCEFIRK